jgi:predicted glycosyltransferase involved in capsule biosynthesis
VTTFTREQYIKINGFSNQFFGWGGEDDDLYRR